MTNLHLSDTRPALRSRRPTAAVRVAGFAIALAALVPVSRVAAQAPASAPPPPRPVVVQTPARVPPPPVASPPPAGRPAAATAARLAPTTPTAVRAAPAPVGVPLDSTRPKAAVSSAPPANAVALCRDGTYIVAPSDASACGTHRGLQVAMIQRATPPAAAGRVAAPAAAVRATPAAPASTPPPGATTLCKDGTWLNGAPAAGACAGHAGLAMTVPQARGTPHPPVAVTSAPRPAPKGTVNEATPAVSKPAPAVPTPAKPAQARPAPAKPAPKPSPNP